MRRRPDCDMAAAATSALSLRVASDYRRLGEQAAEFIVAQLKQEPDLLLCVSAGGTPTQTYQCLAARRARQPQLFDRLRVIQIDEWAGLPRHSEGTCEADLRQKVLSPLGIAAGRFAGWRSNVANPEAECRRISQWLAANGPIDICILGLGLNGHIAMNEPGSCFMPFAHVAKLARGSRHHPMLKGLRRKPTCGLTLGLGEILQSRKVLLLVSGKKKRAVLRRLMNPEITTHFPASFLWLHPDATVLCDQEAIEGF